MSLMQDNGIRVKKILQMDAGLRSRHTNAYFTGIGKTKQIVLFDTLIESHTVDEILAVLAHEAGHFRKKHVLKQLVIFECFSLAGFYATWFFMKWPTLYATFGFGSPLPYVGLFLTGVFWQKSRLFPATSLHGTVAALRKRSRRLCPKHGQDCHSHDAGTQAAGRGQPLQYQSPPSLCVVPLLPPAYNGADSCPG